MYELNGDSVPLRLTFDRPVFDARTTDVLERPGAGLRVNGKQVELKLAPYRIETIRVSVKPR